MNLSLYTPQEEENIYSCRQARTWRRSDLITEDQLRVITEATATDLRQTNLFFRILFFIFTCLCAGALVGLIVWMLGSTKVPTLILWFIGIIYYTAAEHLADKSRLYRHGIEEGLALTAMILFCIGCIGFMDDLGFRIREITIALSGLLAVTAFWIHLRFGWLYAALLSVIALGVIPFQLSVSPVAERLLLLLILCGLFAFSLAADKPDREDFRKDRYAKIQAGLFIAIYLTVNLEIPGLAGLMSGAAHGPLLYAKSFPPYLYWSSYVLTFLIPAALIIMGIRSRKRLVLNAGLFMACATLTTNKSYLGMTRYAWDPIILGTVMIALSLFISRWLNAGPDQQKYGFTAKDILKPENFGINLADAAAALTPGAIDAQQPPPAPQDQFFEGGSSGGGGAERKF
jgi:hypothetical protein